MFRAALFAVPLVVASFTVSVPGIGIGEATAQSLSGEQCQRRNDGRRRGMSALGALGRGVLGRVGGGAVANMVLPMASMLGDAIMAMLDCDEQEKAATATEQVVEQAAERGDAAVGTTVNWESETRQGVRGSSTITEVASNSPDGDCMTVTDIVIVDGEETRAPKRMCRRPPSNRYVRV